MGKLSDTVRDHNEDPGDGGAARSIDPETVWTLLQSEDARLLDLIAHLPPPEASVPGLHALIEGSLPSGRYRARELVGVVA